MRVQQSKTKKLGLLQSDLCGDRVVEAQARHNPKFHTLSVVRIEGVRGYGEH